MGLSQEEALSKGIDVIYSCKTEEQLVVCRTYIRLLGKRYKLSKWFMGSLLCDLDYMSDLIRLTPKPKFNYKHC